MKGLLALSRLIDRITRMIGRSAAWLIVAAAVISAGNAVVRKAFDWSANSLLEIQWWLFAMVFLLAAPWTLAVNEHIRIDVVNSRLSDFKRNVIELVGHALFLLPVAAMVIYTSWLFFISSYAQNEQSPNAGGLPLWPIKALIPIAFALLFAQGVSELIKRVAIMRGELDERTGHGGYHEAVVAAGADLTHDAGGGTSKPEGDAR
ncbi:TRAP transporter small permease subunit [Hyphomicrobium sp.]|uniref:TRAP transporter small permease subunit n=1 Tax=Hyphomicrobium sp. TaxID=82 RepID=UPI0025B7BAF5|nr:TRAP transporter small permease subunit [Hyphomicrobium sp.]MCC7251177.1 TRAP transporter small permease subunit [Hyphomicrobium sp.]